MYFYQEEDDSYFQMQRQKWCEDVECDIADLVFDLYKTAFHDCILQLKQQ